MSDNETSVQSAPASAPAKRTRGPRSDLTAGDITTLYRLSRGNMDQVREAVSEHSEAVVAAALKALHKTNPSLAADLGFVELPKDELAVDFRRGVFVHLADFGVAKGTIVKVSRPGDGTVVLTPVL